MYASFKNCSCVQVLFGSFKKCSQFSKMFGFSKKTFMFSIFGRFYKKIPILKKCLRFWNCWLFQILFTISKSVRCFIQPSCLFLKKYVFPARGTVFWVWKPRLEPPGLKKIVFSKLIWGFNKCSHFIIISWIQDMLRTFVKIFSIS